MRFLLTGRALPRQALVQDIVLCKDLQVLESVQQVLAFLTGQGKLRHKVGRSFEQRHVPSLVQLLDAGSPAGQQQAAVR